MSSSFPLSVLAITYKVKFIRLNPGLLDNILFWTLLCNKKSVCVYQQGRIFLSMLLLSNVNTDLELITLLGYETTAAKFHK